MKNTIKDVYIDMCGVRNRIESERK